MKMREPIAWCLFVATVVVTVVQVRDRRRAESALGACAATLQRTEQELDHVRADTSPAREVESLRQQLATAVAAASDCNNKLLALTPPPPPALPAVASTEEKPIRDTPQTAALAYLSVDTIRPGILRKLSTLKGDYLREWWYHCHFRDSQMIVVGFADEEVREEHVRASLARAVELYGWNAETCHRVRAGQAWVGMTAEQLSWSLPRPARITRTETSAGVAEQWEYSPSQSGVPYAVYSVVNGRLADWTLHSERRP